MRVKFIPKHQKAAVVENAKQEKEKDAAQKRNAEETKENQRKTKENPKEEGKIY